MDIISIERRETRERINVPMTDPIYIIDLETTGLDGYPDNHVVEIGIAEFNQMTGDIRAVYDAVIHVPNIREINENTVERDGTKGCWVFNHTSLTVEDVENGRPLEEVVKEVRELLNGKAVSAYNIPFDFDKFLDKCPWHINEITERRQDVAEVAKKVIVSLIKRDKYIPDAELRERVRSYHERYPEGIFRSEDAYKILCNDDPAGIGKVQKHRALDDAIREAWIMKRASRTMAVAYISDWLFRMFNPSFSNMDMLDKGDLL